MPRVPETQLSSQRVIAAPIQEQNIRTNDAAFGGAEARALQGVGQSLGQAGQALLERENYLREQESVTKSVEAYNNFRDSWRVEEENFKGLQGTDAAGVTKKVKEKFDEMSKVAGNGLNDNALKRLNALIQQSRNSTLDAFARHERDQSKAAYNNQMQALQETAINDAVEGFGDQATIDNSRTVIRTAVRASMQGQSEDAIKAVTDAQLSKMHAGIVGRLVNQDVDAAQAYYESQKDQIDGSVRVQIEKMLAPKIEAERAEELLSEHYMEDKPIDEIAKGIRNSGAPQNVKDEAIRRANNRKAQERAAEAEKMENANKAAWDTIREQGSIDAIPATILSELSPDQVNKLKMEESRIRNGHQTITDSKAWQEFVTMPSQERAAIDVYAEYADKFDQQDFQRALALQAEDRSPKSGAGVKTSRETDYNNILRDVASKFGLIDENDTLAKVRQNKSSNAKRFKALDKRLRLEVDTWHENNKGKQITQTEIGRIADSIVSDVVYVDEWGADPEIPIAALTPDDIDKAYLDADTINPDVRKSLIEAFPNRRRRLSREDVADMKLDVQLGRPVNKVSVTDIPKDAADQIKQAFEIMGRTFRNDAERDQAYLELYIKWVLNGY